MLTAAQIEARRLGLGGTDCAPLLGLSPFRTALDVYQEKIGEGTPVVETKRMRRGSALEPMVLQKFCNVMGVNVERYRDAIVSPIHPFMRANLDGRMPDGPLVEAKCSWSAQGWGDDGSDEVPAYYQTQACHYFGVVPDAEVCYFPVLFGMDSLDWEPMLRQRATDNELETVWVPKIADDADFRIFCIRRDAGFIKDVVDVERAFWHDNVLARVPPAPVNREDAAKLWARDSGSRVEIDSVIADKLAQHKDLGAKVSDLEKQRKALGNAIAVAFGEHAIANFNGIDVATYKAQTRKSYVVEESTFRVLRHK